MAGMTIDQRLRTIARGQLGLLTRDQLVASGLDRDQISARVANGSLERVSPEVFRIGGAPLNRRQFALAAVLDLGEAAAASHTTAAALWRQPGYDLREVHVMRFARGNRRASNLATPHDPKLLLPSHVTSMGALKVTTPSRTLFDLAAIVHPLKLARTVDDVLASRLTNVRALHEMLRILACRGRTGITAMRSVLEQRPIGYVAPESHLESRVRDILERSGLHGFDRQVDVGDDDGWIGRVDFLHRPSGFILMADGDRWHRQLVDRITDAEQHRRLAAAGYRLDRVTETQVWMRPQEVAATARRYVLAAA
jgi:very-short-patch-repair endonuclease